MPSRSRQAVATKGTCARFGTAGSWCAGDCSDSSRGNGRCASSLDDSASASTFECLSSRFGGSRARCARWRLVHRPDFCVCAEIGDVPVPAANSPLNPPKQAMTTSLPSPGRAPPCASTSPARLLRSSVHAWRGSGKACHRTRGVDRTGITRGGSVSPESFGHCGSRERSLEGVSHVY